jgi:glycosyltransferase involved in cell wall biosynthesis
MGFSVRLLVMQGRTDLAERELEFVPPGIDVVYANYAPVGREFLLLLLWRKIGYLLWRRNHAFAWWAGAYPAEFLSRQVAHRKPTAVLIRSVFMEALEKLRSVYDGPVIVDCHDADVHLALEAVRSVPFWRRFGPLANLAAIRRACAAYLPFADEIWAVSRQDARRIQSQAAVRRVIVVPSAVEDSGAADWAPGDEPIAVLIANYGYGPNANGVRWLIGKVWPLVLQAMPAARLELVGANLPAGLEKRCKEMPGCTVHGLVHSLKPIYHRASVMLAPILEGGGTRLKIVEAWGQGKAVLTTAKGIEGLSAPESCAVIADDPRQFAQELVSLFNDRAKRTRLGKAGRCFVREHLSYSNVLKTMERESLLQYSEVFQ